MATRTTKATEPVKEDQAAALNQPLSQILDSFYGYGAVPSDNFGNGAYPTMAMIDAHGIVRNVAIGALERQVQSIRGGVADLPDAFVETLQTAVEGVRAVVRGQGKGASVEREPRGAGRGRSMARPSA